MRDQILKKLQSLSEEAQALVQDRDRYHQMVQEIEVRLHQVSGAITEIDSLLKSLEKEEPKAETSNEAK